MSSTSEEVPSAKANVFDIIRQNYFEGHYFKVKYTIYTLTFGDKGLTEYKYQENQEEYSGLFETINADESGSINEQVCFERKQITNKMMNDMKNGVFFFENIKYTRDSVTSTTIYMLTVVRHISKFEPDKVENHVVPIPTKTCIRFHYLEIERCTYHDADGNNVVEVPNTLAIPQTIVVNKKRRWKHLQDPLCQDFTLYTEEKLHEMLLYNEGSVTHSAFATPNAFFNPFDKDNLLINNEYMEMSMDRIRTKMIPYQGGYKFTLNIFQLK